MKNDTAQEILLQARYALALPMRLQIQVGEDIAQTIQTLDLLQVFRILPGKRVVALAVWKGQTVVAKLFFCPSRWREHLRRELKGIHAMQEAGVATPPVVEQGYLPQHATERKSFGAVLLLHYLENGQSVGECWEQSQTALERHVLINSVLTKIAKCHHLGLIQYDIHLDNFMVQGEKIYVLDSADIHARGSAERVSDAECLQNLALFFAQFPVCNDEHLHAFFEHYIGSRKSLNDDVALSFEEFPTLVRQARVQRWHAYARKLFRETSANHCEQSWRRFLIYNRRIESAQLHAFIDNPNQCIDQGRVIKAGNSATVAVVNIDGTEYIVKRHNIKNFWHGLSRLLLPSRAWKNWRNAHMLQMLGLGTATPFLMMERRIGPLRREAYFVAESVTGQDVLQFLEKEPINGSFWQNALQQFRTLFQVMEQYRIIHGDMKASNFISTPQQLVVLDLDAMRMESNEAKFLRGFKRDLRRFQENWSNHADVAEPVAQLVAEFTIINSRVSAEANERKD